MPTISNSTVPIATPVSVLPPETGGTLDLGDYNGNDALLVACATPTLRSLYKQPFQLLHFLGGEC